MKIEIKIILNDNKARLGAGAVIDDKNNVVLQFCTLELPFNNNITRKSSIPLGTYKVRKRYSIKYGWHFHIQNVPKRDMILIHVANYTRELLGCIAVGSAHKDIDKDGTKDVINSKKTMDKLNKIMPKEFELTITQ